MPYDWERFKAGLASARPAPSLLGREYFATDTGALSVDTGTAWSDVGGGGPVSSIVVKDKPWCDVTHPSFGAVADGVTDNTAAFQAAIDYAFANNIAVFVPNVGASGSSFYKFTGSVNLAGRQGTYIFGEGGYRRGLGFSTPPSTELSNVTNSNPIFICDGDAITAVQDGYKFENLAMFGAAIKGTSMRRVIVDNCCFLGTGTNPCFQIENSFWWKWINCGISAASTATPAIILRGKTAAADENICYLMEWQHCTFNYNPIRYEQYVNYSPNRDPGAFTFIDCDTENLADNNVGLIDLRRTGTMTDILRLSGVIVDGFEHFDTTGSTSVPLISCPSGTSVSRITARVITVYGEFIRCEAANPPTDISVMAKANSVPMVRNAAHSLVDTLGQEEKTGEWTFYGNTAVPTLYGFGAQYGSDTARRWGVRADGKHEWGDGTNPIDVNWYRGAAGIIKTDNQIQANKVSVGTNGFIGSEKIRLNGTGSSVGWDLEDGTGSVKTRAGSGSPESAVTAGPGSLYCDYTNGEVYVKKTGTGNTGWKIITHA